jgi:hypothetical protein
MAELLLKLNAGDKGMDLEAVERAAARVIGIGRFTDDYLRLCKVQGHTVDSVVEILTWDETNPNIRIRVGNVQTIIAKTWVEADPSTFRYYV